MKNIENVIYEFLNEIGVPNKLKGYYDLMLAIKYVYEKGLVRLPACGEYGIYEYVAKIGESHDKRRVEKNIRFAIEQTFTNANLETITKYFSGIYSYEKGKTTNKNFIYRAASIVKGRMEE